MPVTRFFWDIESVQIPYLNCRTSANVVEKMRAKLGNGPVVVVGDENRLKESGNSAIGIKAVPCLEFIHVPFVQRNTMSKILIEKMTAIFWAKGDILVLLAADGALNKEVTMLKAKGVTVKIIGNKMNELFAKLQAIAGRSYVYQWSDILY